MARWKPSRTRARAFAQQMSDIDQFCIDHKIRKSGGSYYFTVNGQQYRVSNHSVEASNSAAFNRMTGERKRPLYHEGGRRDDTIYIHASQTRIVEIYNALAQGYELDGRGYRRTNNA